MEFFFGARARGQEGQKIDETLHFCGLTFSRNRRWRALRRQKGLQKLAKGVGVKIFSAKVFVLDHLEPSFWRSVSGGAFSCGAERVFWAPITRENDIPLELLASSPPTIFGLTQPNFTRKFGA